MAAVDMEQLAISWQLDILSGAPPFPPGEPLGSLGDPTGISGGALVISLMTPRTLLGPLRHLPPPCLSDPKKSRILPGATWGAPGCLRGAPGIPETSHRTSDTSPEAPQRYPLASFALGGCSCSLHSGTDAGTAFRIAGCAQRHELTPRTLLGPLRHLPPPCLSDPKKSRILPGATWGAPGCLRGAPGIPETSHRTSDTSPEAPQRYPLASFALGGCSCSLHSGTDAGTAFRIAGCAQRHEWPINS